MTLTAGQLAPLAASAKTEIDRVIALASPTVQEITDSQVVGFDYSAVSYATLGELLNAKQSGYDMSIVTMADLDTHIQVYVDNSTLLSIDNLQRLRFITMPARIREPVITEVVQVITTSNAVHPVPSGATKCLVTAGAAGGDTPVTSSGAISGGGGGGAKVVDFEIGVDGSGTGTLNVVVGNTITVGALDITSGGVGGVVNPTFSGGAGGQVLLSGTPQLDSATVISGGAGGAGSNTSTISGAGEDAGGYTGGIGISHPNGSGGGGGASYGGDGADAQTFSANGVSPNNMYGSGASGSGYNSNASIITGGTYTDVTLKFTVETLV